MGNDGHVTDIGRPIHEGTDLVDGEAIDNMLALLLQRQSAKFLILNHGGGWRGRGRP